MLTFGGIGNGVRHWRWGVEWESNRQASPVGARDGDGLKEDGARRPAR